MYLLILLLLTVLVFKTLFSNFGFTTSQEKEKAIKDFIENTSNENTIIDGKVVNKEKDTKTALTAIYNNYLNRKKNEKNIKEQEDKTIKVFDKELFLKSSEKAIVYILDYFSNENLESLRNLLTNNMYSIFEKQININKEKKIIYKTILVAITNKEILDITNCETKIKMKLEMDQINYVEDLEGNIVNGSKDKIQKITENWTFVLENNLWLLDSIE